MNADNDYTICNLDSHSYGNGYSNSEIPATIYGYNTGINNRSIDTGQHYYGTENLIPHGLSGVDLSLGTNQGVSGYPVNSNVISRGARHPGYDLTDPQTHGGVGVDPYLTGHHGLTLNGDNGHLGGGGGLGLSPGRNSYGGGCVDSLGSCSLGNVYGATIAQSVPSPIKSEPSAGQNLQSKPFRWMQIKRNPAKATGKSFHHIAPIVTC